MRRVAIVHGHKGRVGSAFASRLAADGFDVVTGDAIAALELPMLDVRTFLFDCAYQHEDPVGHVERAAKHLADWRRLAGIFIPSSLHIGTDTAYGRAKLVIEQLVAFYRSEGANVVTDRIGYFPGDGVTGDVTNPYYHKLVTGNVLYARVMAKLLADPIVATDRHATPGTRAATPLGPIAVAGTHA